MSKQFFELCVNNKLAEAKAMYNDSIDLGLTALGGNTALTLAAHKGHQEVCEWLIEIGSPLDAVTDKGETALIRTAIVGHPKIALALLKAEADTDIIDKEGRTALMYALKGRQDEIVFYLVKCGADIEIADKNGKTAEDYAKAAGTETHSKFTYLLEQDGNEDDDEDEDYEFSGGFIELIEKYGFIGAWRQQQLNKEIDEYQWQLNWEKCELLLGNAEVGVKFTFPIKPLGSYAQSNESWWGALLNTSFDKYPGITSLAESVTELGKKLGVEELEKSSFDGIPFAYMPLLGSVVAGYFKMKSFFIASGETASFLLIITEQAEDNVPFPPAEFMPAMSQIFQVCPQINMRNMFKNYLEYIGFEWKDDGENTIGTCKEGTTPPNGEKTMTAKFNEYNMLTGLDIGYAD